MKVPRRALLGLVGAVLAAAVTVTAVVLASLADDQPADARSTPLVRSHGAVAADGSPEETTGPASFHVRHDLPGRYLVEVAAGPVATVIELRAWDAAADAQVTPVGPGRALVTFARGGVAVDTRFSFDVVAGG